MCHDWPVKKSIVNLPIRLKGNSKHICGNALSLLEVQNKDINAASHMLLTRVKLRLWCRPSWSWRTKQI